MHEIVQTYLEHLYSDINNHHHRTIKGDGSLIYGEIYYYSLNKLLSKINYKNTDHFLDIGSGLGKVIFQLFFTTNLVFITGIEISKERHDIATDILKQIKTDLPQYFMNSKQNKQITLINYDFINLNSTFKNFNIVYICSTVFSKNLLFSIGKKINSMPNVHTLISFRRIPNLIKLTLVDVIQLEGSWDSSLCYIYKKE